jgi:hypothetical protein
LAPQSGIALKACKSAARLAELRGPHFAGRPRQTCNYYRGEEERFLKHSSLLDGSP